LKSTVIRASRRAVMLVDHSKYGSTAFSVFARAEDIDVLVTDSAFAEKEKVAALGIELVVADAEPALKVNES